MRRTRQSVYGAILGICAVGVVTLLAVRANLNLPASGLFHLLIVLFIALRIGFWEASLVSLFSNFCLLYFVVPPVFSLRIQDPQNWVALCVFELTALLVSRLSARAQTQASTANQRHSELEKLYELSRQLLLLNKESESASQTVKLIQRIFPSEAVMLFDVRSEAVHSAFECRDLPLENLTRKACLEERDVELPEANAWVRVLWLEGCVIGSLGLRGKEFSALMTKALASLAVISLERARSFEAESRATADKRTEELRTAVLDSLAHEFKTPLTVIRTASNGLLAMDGLGPSQREMLNLVDHEATKLTDITTKLLRASRLEKRIPERVSEPVSFAGEGIYRLINEPISPA